jgi:hypothetical protein
MFVASVIALAGAISAQTRPQTPACGRACLVRTATFYFEALVAHDPARVPLAANLKFVENVTPMKAGEGMWKTASAVPTTFRIDVPDPVSQQVGVIAVMEENGKPIQIGLRLKLSGGKIVEAEHLVVHTLGERNLPNLQKPRPGLLATLPPSERLPRDNMLKIGASYYDALDDNKGSLAPFAGDCIRRENGMQTNANPMPPNGGPAALISSMRCGPQLDTQTMSYIDTIDNRRVEIADPETGLVFGLSHFRHSMKEKTLKISGVPGMETRAMNFNAFDLPAAHIFQTRGGQIHEIEAMGFSAPYNSKTGWE